MITGRLGYREARALLQWDVSKLAKRTGIDLVVILRAEKVDSTPSITLVQAGLIQQARAGRSEVWPRRWRFAGNWEGTAMTSDPAAAKARAEAHFKPQASAAVGRDHQAKDAARNAQAEKTAKLRALRLAKEESDRIAAEVRRARREQRRP